MTLRAQGSDGPPELLAPVKHLGFHRAESVPEGEEGSAEPFAEKSVRVPSHRFTPLLLGSAKG